MKCIHCRTEQLDDGTWFYHANLRCGLCLRKQQEQESEGQPVVISTGEISGNL